MKKNSLFYLIFFILLLFSFIFFGNAYRELTRYAELTSHSIRLYTSYENLAKEVTTAAVISPELNQASKDAEIENLFYTDEESILQHLRLLSSIVTDSINIKIAQQLDTNIKAELRWLLKSNVPDSIVYRSSSEHIVRLNEIDSLISTGKKQTKFLLTSGNVKLADAISDRLSWMLVFIGLSGIVSVYTIVIEQRKAAHNMRNVTEQKQTEEKIRASELSYRSLIEQASDAIFVANSDGRYIDVNSIAGKILGYEREEVLTLTPKDILYHKEKIEDIPERLAQLREGKSVITENTLKKKDGTPVHVEINARMMSDGRIVEIVRDITERKRAAEQLDKSEKRFRALIENSDDVIAMMDENMSSFYRSSSAERLTGYTSDDQISGTKIDDVHPEDIEKIKNCLLELRSVPGKTIHLTYRVKHKKGHYIWLEGTFTNLFEDPNVGAIVANLRDITDRKNTELKLSQTVKEVTDYKFALDEACIVAITDQEGIITYTNENFCRISKYSRDELIGQDHRIINSGHHSKEFIKGIWTTIANGKVWRDEIKNRAKDGSYYWVDTTIIPFLNKQHKPYQYMAIRADITERKSVEERIAANEEKLRFILDNMIEGVQIIGFDWKYVYLNNTAVMHSQYPARDLIGYTILEKYPGFEDSDLFQLLRKTMDERVAHQIENKFIYPNGLVAWFQLSIQPVPEGVFILSVDITSRKLAEEKLISSEERFRALIENMSDAIVLNDENSHVIYQSPSVTRILGYTLEESKGKPVYDFAHPDDQFDFEELYKRLKETPRFPFLFQYRFLHKNGHYVWLEGVVTNLLSEPSVKGFVANFRDITDRKEGEEKLRRERSLLRTLVDNLPDYIYVKDTQSRHILNNAANVSLMGSHSEEETLGKTVADIMGPEITRPFHEDDQRVFTSGKPILDHEEIVLTTTGEVKHLLTTKVPLRDSQNTIVGLVGISRDITKQKKIELDLRNSNYFLEAAQRVGKIGHWISEIGQHGKLIWSAETCHIFGLAPEEFDGTLETFFNFIHPSDLALLNFSVQNAIKNKRTYSIDHRIILRDKTVKWVHEQGETTVGESGNAIQLVGIVQDITERKKAETQILAFNRDLEERVKTRTAQLEVVNKEMEAFTYSVSHDLRSPLRIIDGYAQILIEDYVAKLDEEGKRTLGIIMSNAKKMGQLIDDLLNFSKIGRTEIRKINVNMNQIVDEVIQELRLGGETIPRHLKIDILPSANCDASLIKQLWINLLSNAIKYSGAKPEPEISIGTTHRDGKAIYFIKDNGAGFDMQYYHKLFGVFQRLHSHYEFSGTGVGLAIVNSIINRHGGSIWAESKVNEGATFYFSLD